MDVSNDAASAMADSASGNPRRKNTLRRHCEHPDACRAKKRGRMCRPCVLVAINADPDIQARRLARSAATIRAKMSDPEFAEKMRQNGLKHGVKNLRAAMPGFQTAEHRAKMSRLRTETMLGWCPLEYRDEYRRLCAAGSSLRFSAAEARRIIEEQIEADRRRYLQTGQLQASKREGSRP